MLLHQNTNMKIEVVTSKKREYKHVPVGTGMTSSEKHTVEPEMKSTSKRNDTQTGSHKRLKAISKILSRNFIRTSTNIIFDSDDDEDDIIILNDKTLARTKNQPSSLDKHIFNETVFDSDSDSMVNSDTDTVILSIHSSENNSKADNISVKSNNIINNSVGNDNNKKSIIDAILEERLLCLTDDSKCKVHTVSGECGKKLDYIKNTCTLNPTNNGCPTDTISKDSTENIIDGLFNSSIVKTESNLNLIVKVEEQWEPSVTITKVESVINANMTEAAATIPNNVYAHGQLQQPYVEGKMNENEMHSTSTALKQTVGFPVCDANSHHVQNAQTELNTPSMLSTACHVAQILKGYLPIIIQNYFFICAEDENYYVLNSVINTSLIYHITEDQYKIVKGILDRYWLDKAFYEQLRSLVTAGMNIVVKSFDFFLKSLVGYILASVNPYIVTTALPNQSSILATSGQNFSLRPELHQQLSQQVSMHQLQTGNTIPNNLPNTEYYVYQNSYTANNQNPISKSKQTKPKKSVANGKKTKSKVNTNKANNLKYTPTMSESRSKYISKIVIMPSQTVQQVSERVVTQCTETRISVSGASTETNSQYSSAYPIIPNQFISSTPRNLKNNVVLPLQPAHQLGTQFQQQNEFWNNDGSPQNAMQSSNSNTYKNKSIDVDSCRSQQIGYSSLNNNSYYSINKLPIAYNTQTLTPHPSNIHHINQIDWNTNYHVSEHLKVNPKLKTNKRLTKQHSHVKLNANTRAIPKSKQSQFATHTDESNRSNVTAVTPESLSIKARGGGIMIPNNVINLPRTQACYAGTNSFEYQTAPSLNKNCACCGKATKLQCSRCSNTYFCSIICQARTWSSHKKSCRPKMQELRVE